jgi:hypothetical protein
MKTPALLGACLGLALLPTPQVAAVQITFSVNMSAQIGLGAFNPDSDTVFVAGDPINEWSTTASELIRSASNANLWVGTFDVPGTEGNTVQYKYLMTGPSSTTWEGQVGPGGGTGNRTFTLPAKDEALPIVYFNNVTNSTSVTADVTFQVDMSVQIALGSFNRDSDTVYLAGEFNSWNATAFALTNSIPNPDVWVGVLPLTGALDSTMSYKFVINGSTWEGNVGPNGGQNRTVTLQKTAQVLPVVFFNNLAAQPTVIPVTFQLDMSTQIAKGNFDPAATTVAVAGDPLNSWSATASMLTQNATDTNLWTGTFDLTSTAGSVLLYKFVLGDGATWESIDNRTYTIASTNAQTLPRAFFNNTNDLGRLTWTAPSGGQATLSWTAGPLIRLQSATDPGKGAWQDVANTQGQGTATVNVGSGPSYFRLIGP